MGRPWRPAIDEMFTMHAAVAGVAHHPTGQLGDEIDARSGSRRRCGTRRRRPCRGSGAAPASLGSAALFTMMSMPPSSRDGGVDHRLHLVLVGHVAVDAEGASAHGARSPRPRMRRPANPRLLVSREAETGHGGCRRPRRRTPPPPVAARSPGRSRASGRSGDERDFSIQPVLDESVHGLILPLIEGTIGR